MLFELHLTGLVGFQEADRRKGREFQVNGTGCAKLIKVRGSFIISGRRQIGVTVVLSLDLLVRITLSF